MPETARDAIRIVERDGWYHVANQGQPPSLPCHPVKPGQGDYRWAIRARNCRDVARVASISCVKQAGDEGYRKEQTMKLTYKYVVVHSRGRRTAGAPMCPTCSGCVGVGDTWEETLELIKEALAGHIELMLEDSAIRCRSRRSPLTRSSGHHLEFIVSMTMTLWTSDCRVLMNRSPTVAVRFEPVEIKIRVPEASQSGVPEPAQVG